MTTLSDAPTLELRVVVDPRIKQRWVDVRRSEGRRRLQLIVVAAVVAGLIGAAIGVLYTPLVGVRTVEVRGEGALSLRQIERVAGLGHQPMVDVHPSTVAARLEAVPIIGTARVERRWPRTVQIQLTLRTAVAQAEVGGRTLELDATGRVLTAVAAPVATLPVLNGLSIPSSVPGRWVVGAVGPAGSATAPPASWLVAPPTIAAAALALSANLPAAVASRVESFTVAGATLQAIVTTNAGDTVVPVLFGDQSQLSTKLTALTTVLQQVDLAGMAQIDLRVPDRPVLTP